MQSHLKMLNITIYDDNMIIFIRLLEEGDYGIIAAPSTDSLLRLILV